MLIVNSLFWHVICRYIAQKKLSVMVFFFFKKKKVMNSIPMKPNPPNFPWEKSLLQLY